MGCWGLLPPPPPLNFYPQEIKICPIWGYPRVIFMEIKIIVTSWNCMSMCSFHKLPFTAQLIFFYRKATSFIILKIMSLLEVAQQENNPKTNKNTHKFQTNAKFWVFPRLFTSPARPIQLSFTDWYPLPFIGTVTVIQMFTMVDNSSKRHDESFKLSLFSLLKQWPRSMYE